jgi:peptidoglycan/xylan/chitin deacetylase (PgdA/CDA1 family)
MRWPNFKRKAVTLSYDDGVSADKRLIPILDKNGLKCTFNINSGMFAQEEGAHGDFHGKI